MYFYRAVQTCFRLYVLEREMSLATFFGILFFRFTTEAGLEVLVLRSRTVRVSDDTTVVIAELVLTP